jgi:hypothetical protein
MGEARREALRVDFDRSIKLEFHGAKVSSDGGLLAYRELDVALHLAEMAREVLTDVRTGDNIQHDMVALLRQSVFSRLAGYEDTNDGDLERVLLRNAHVHGADDWRSVLEPVVERYRGENLPKFFRADAAFASPEVYEFLEAEGFLYAMRLPGNPVLDDSIRRWSSRGVVRFYNQRGRAEPWIKEGKYVPNWTRLSCHDFLDNQVRLQLFALAYNLGNFLRRLAFLSGSEAADSWSWTPEPRRNRAERALILA